jgi:hypothetical protein
MESKKTEQKSTSELRKRAVGKLKSQTTATGSILEVSEENVYVLALMSDVSDRKRVEEEIPQLCIENTETLMRENRQ